MNNRDQLLTGKEFIEQLTNDKINRPIYFIGMVKKLSDNEEHFLFSQEGNCEGWIKVPVASVQDVEILDMVSCTDHQHPLVVLHIKQPQSEEALLFLALSQRSSGNSPITPLPANSDDCINRGMGLCDGWFKGANARFRCYQRVLDIC
jgi:hypothetical protein